MAEDAPENSAVDAHRSRKATRAVYDDIASHFSKTRAYPWPEVETFLDGRTGQVGVDLGCGNGRHAQLVASCTDRVLAVDVSRDLLDETRKHMHENGWNGELLQADAARLPISTNAVDLAVYVATLHHLPDRETRRASLRELARVVGEGGRALVSAWSTEHDRFDVEDASEGFDTTIDWTLPGGETVPRFYHIYAPTEFERDLRESGLAIEDVCVSSGNCYAVVSASR